MSKKNDIIEQLSANQIYAYGSPELNKYEKNMKRYFEREYKRWQGNKNRPEFYGVSSFDGDIASKATIKESIDHYNKELKIYQAFLDKKFMVYTMAYYGATADSPDIDNSISLEQAQIEKYDLIIQRADIKDRQTILELGCGFGGFTCYLHQKFPNIQVTGVNPSDIQTDFLREHLAEKSKAFDAKRFTLVQKFFDDLTPDDFDNKRFDRVISIGVLEAVKNLDKLFEMIAGVLVPGGKTFHHFIVSSDTIPQFLNAEDTLMAEYFPGGHIWPYDEARRHTRHLKLVNSWFVNGMNYWKTLDEWHKRFWESIEQLYPECLTLQEVEDWNKYFILCKAMFCPDSGNSYGNGHYLYQAD